MAIFGKMVYLAVVLVLGYLLTVRAIPWVATRLGRLMGFRMQASPITLKRIRRFKRIRRGYRSFLIIATAGVTSLFLELVVNEKPLFIRYENNWAMPALKEWTARVAGIAFIEIPTFNKKDDFGQAGDSEVDYRLFARCVADPSLLDPKIEDAGERYEKARERFEKLTLPKPDDSEFKKSRYAQRKQTAAKRESQLRRLEQAKGVFQRGEARVWQTLHPYSPTTLRHDLEKNPPNKPSPRQGIPLGTTVAGRDVLVLLVYGFRISLAFALMVALCGYSIGIVVGAIQGYYGGVVDIVTQRIVEIWGSVPFLFTIMILASLVTPNFWVLAILMVCLRSWLGITFYVRGEFYREKAKDYVQAAIGTGVSDWKIMVAHILPNSLVPVVTFMPFGIVAYISSLVSLDYLGFGLPPGTPSWGALLRQGLDNVKWYPHLVMVPVCALASTLYMVVMVGEAAREAFDPKVFSRLR